MDRHAPGAPTTMVMNPTAQWVFTLLHFAVAIGLTAWVWRRWDRGEARIALLVLLGGGLSIIAEPFFDRLGFIWHATVNQWTFVSLFGHSVPVWMFPVYFWFIGGQTVYILHRLRAGASVRDMWWLYAVFCVMDAVLELPILYVGGVYTYFGNQPFWEADWFPLPGWYIFANGELPFAAAAVVLLLSSLGDRRYAYAIPIAKPMATFAVYAAIAWPVWAALDADASTFVSYAAGLATIALVLFTRQVLATACVRTVAGGGAETFWPTRTAASVPVVPSRGA
ncbi:hypothetical protein MANY_39580 [Mycolicibacterium anyangense]|uniref:Carotenoid biosynthesis protein n=1 Tax=Mycolicibacterium anyangense TaxID=1431246 RepID=A0A6N4WHE1_9MYCO|nr:hypothetical protein [Mycolicibacterium anyangense]BBZ78621.1 hypothetical protein MANY_39580 [Mycolicibacterium anyangense]